MAKRGGILPWLLGALLLILAGCGGSTAGPTKEYKMSVVTNENSSWYKGAQKFADLVKERSGGRLTIKVFPNAQLAGGNQVKELEMLQNGAINFTYHSNILYTNIHPAFNVISMPFLFRSEKDADAFTGGDAGKQLLNMVAEKGIVGLAYGENGFRQLTNSKQAVVRPDDMKGLKVRIPGIKMYTSIYKALGANPTVMNFGEVFGALQQKVIDGQENPLDVIVSAKLFEVQKFITMWNYSYDALILGMNKKAFDELPRADQELIRKAAQEASQLQVKLNREANASHLQTMKEKGMAVTELTPEQMAAFKQIVAPVYAEYEPVVGKELLDKAKAVVK